MNTRLLILSLSLLAATFPIAPVWADDAAAATLQRPLNLSLPRETRPLPSVTFDGASDVDPVERNLRETQIRDGRSNERLPYGSGYEARQRGGAGQGAGGGSATGGGRGRGSMGRGR